MKTLPEKLGEIIPYNKAEHLHLIQKWWAEYYDGFSFADECLPETGVVVAYKGKPVAAAFIYQTNAKMAMIHYPVVDPSLGAGNRVFFLRTVVDGAIEAAKVWLGGEGFIFSITDHSVVGRTYQQRGMECSGEADLYFYPVGQQSAEMLK